MSGGIIFPDHEVPDEMRAPDNVMPLMFVQPVPLPIALNTDVFADAEGTKWVVLRIETTQGSAVHFLHPDIADNLANDLIDHAGAARITKAGPR